MSKTKKVKKNKLKLMPIIIFVAFAILVYMSLYNGQQVTQKTASPNVLQKLTKDILKNGGEFEITQEDMNGLIGLYFKNPISKGEITIKEINTKMLDGEILIEAPITYKKINLVFSTTGKIGVLDGEITYAADNFKIGKLTLPKKTIMSQISKHSKEDVFYVEDNIVKINTDKFPLNINSLEIKDDKLTGTLGFKGIKSPF